MIYEYVSSVCSWWLQTDYKEVILDEIFFSYLSNRLGLLSVMWVIMSPSQNEKTIFTTLNLREWIYMLLMINFGL